MTPETPNGAAYVATTRLSTRDDETLAAIGDSCERLSAEALAWAIERGYAVPVLEEAFTKIVGAELIAPSPLAEPPVVLEAPVVPAEGDQ